MSSKGELLVQHSMVTDDMDKDKMGSRRRWQLVCTIDPASQADAVGCQVRSTECMFIHA